MDTVRIYAPGSEVNLGAQSVLITEVKIVGKTHAISYLVVWWNGATRESEWVDGCEVTGDCIRMGLRFHT